MTVVPQGPTFPVREIPFSYHGSWFNISPVVAEQTYADDLHLVSHQTGLHPVLRFVPVAAGGDAETVVTAGPANLVWTHEAGQVELVYERADTVRLRGTGLGMRIVAAAATLTPFSGAYLYGDPVDGAWVYTLYETGRRYRVTALSGDTVTAGGAESLGTAERGLTVTGDSWEIAIEEFGSARPPYRAVTDFDEVAKSAAATFAAFLDAVAPWRSPRTPAAELAAYVLWSATVEPAGFVTRPAVLMSKHWMDKVWSWDHCFNALALAAGAPNLAWDQFQLVFDHQDGSGALPDSVTHSEILYNFVKPPIHGWAFGRLRPQLPDALVLPALRDTYRRLAGWTRFWLSHRRADGHPLPHYQHGNDSGWDNATTFDPHRLAETADLTAFLVLQLRQLADLAAELDRPEDAAHWRDTAAHLLTTLVQQLWTGDRFQARSPSTGQTWTSDSLLDLMPIVLGDLLPQPIGQTLATRLRAHLTQWGLATELPSSPHYQADGYWRGPIWAPATVLIEDGLRRAGHTTLADDVSSRFRALCESAGFAENFDAHTGAGLRDRAYTWTAAAYLILASAHEARTG